MLDYIDTLDKLYITIMVFHSGFLLNAVSEYVPETFVWNLCFIGSYHDHDFHCYIRKQNLVEIESFI